MTLLDVAVVHVVVVVGLIGVVFVVALDFKSLIRSD